MLYSVITGGLYAGEWLRHHARKILAVIRMFCLCSCPMGSRNPTRRDLLEHNFPIRLTVTGPTGHGDPVEPALRRVIGRQAFGRLGKQLYLMSLRHASGFICACPTASLDGDWPLRLTIAFETTQELLVRDALQPIVGDAGYVLEKAGHYQAGRPGWHLHMRSVWDAVQFMRMAHPAKLSVDSWQSRNS